MSRADQILKLAQEFEAISEPSAEALADKECNVCHKVYSPEEFSKLPFIGIQKFEDYDEDDPTNVPVLEYRNCDCNGTMVKCISGHLD